MKKIQLRRRTSQHEVMEIPRGTRLPSLPEGDVYNMAEAGLMQAQFELSNYRHAPDRHQRRDRLDLTLNQIEQARQAVGELTARLDAPGGQR